MFHEAMPTFKAVVQPHQERRDGRFPVSIRITHNRRSIYLPTGLYVTRGQINKRTFEIKDQLVLMRTGQTIKEYEQTLLTVDTKTLLSMSSVGLRTLFSSSGRPIDYLGYCHELIESNDTKWKMLKSAVNVIESMGISKMSTSDFTSQFLYQYKQKLDSLGLRNNTKNAYLIAIGHVFRLMQKQYNTEFNKVIPHDPFIGFEYYPKVNTRKRSMEADGIRAFFSMHPTGAATIIAHQAGMLSFCLCGMNIIDLISLKKENYDPVTRRINYNRRKTKDRRADSAFSSIRVEDEIYDIFCRNLAPKSSPFLFRFGADGDLYKITRNIGMNIRRLCIENNMAGVTPYWLRHSWATIARNDCDVSKDDIDLCLNHVGFNPMADVYIKPDWGRIDRANRKVLDFVFHSGNAL